MRPRGRARWNQHHVHNDRVPAMIRPSPWPDLDRLARFLRASDSLTDTLALWTGGGAAVEILSSVDDACPGPLVIEALNLPGGARVHDRAALIRCGDVLVAATRSWAVHSPDLMPATPEELRRVAVRVTALRERPTGDPTAPVLTVQARLDVGSTPVAWCEETILEAVFASDQRPARRRPLRVAA